MPDHSAILRQQLDRDEDTILHAYPDHLGYWTIGTGHLIDKRKGGGISKAAADFILNEDIAACEHDLKLRVPEYVNLSPARQRALINMRFQLGSRGFFGFKKFLKALNAHDYELAAQHGLNSKWAREDTPERARRVMTQLEIGMDVA